VDLGPPELVEERRIIATVDELDELVLALSAPKDEDVEEGHRRIAAEIIYGAEIVEKHPVARGHSQFVVRLPQPLRPYYVLTPLWRCASFTVRVRFGADV
jgi:hypothetical protein